MASKPDGHRPTAGGSHRPHPGQAVYGISVAAELAGIGTHTLRLYEQHGLLVPARSAGGSRRYSDDDLRRLARIAALTEQGINLAAIARILTLEDDNTALRDRNAALAAERDLLREQHTEQKQQPAVGSRTPKLGLGDGTGEVRHVKIERAD
ncbi:MerR family transcriptional regulator [Nocardia stercoris]|uniref:MerR family transcriptional regulator n=1 Tax=Nocardia stercoris TaxID=2483361 RepID=A0A3M2L404_9NOCA|nr:MerR family transcriptional regulator [Nocardia stercoris]RMI31233.1 MerR family transcriptional regulator [Nocardia stercoris]